MQIGLLEPEMLTDPETLKMVTSSFDPKKGTVQAATGSIDGTPTFPHTKVPIMPPDEWQGLSSKEGEHEGHDPGIVAKVPKLMRYQPPPTVQCPIGTRWLRSTWFLCGGSWEKGEDCVEPALQRERIDKYVGALCGNYTRYGQRPQRPLRARLFSRDSILGRTRHFNCSCKKLMAGSSSTRP